MYVTVNKIISTESVAMEMQYSVPFIFALYMSLPAVRNTLTSSRIGPKFLFDFNQISIFSAYFHKRAQ
jgi:hypothetical protein